MRYRSLLTVALTSIGLVSPAFGQTACSINAPSRVDIDQSFTLCGPTGSGLTYEWYGPGVEVDNETRCVTARAGAGGTYEYVLVLRRNGVEVDRCTKVVNVGGTTGGARSCRITGPNSIAAGGTARLCGPDDALHSYRWTGPDGFSATTACVTVTRGGTYFLTSRNNVTGSTRQCTHYLAVAGGTESDCIMGPATAPVGGSVRLCAPSRAGVSYRWTGPENFSASSRCIRVTAIGTYTVTIRVLDTGRTERCTHTLTRPGGGDEQNPDEIIWENCPRTWQFWRRVFDPHGGEAEANGISQAELRAIARVVDERSAYFNWGTDVDGVRQALAPASPLTRRKQVARQFAALLANVAAGEMNLVLRNGERIGLDPDTRGDFAGAATLRDLITTTDRALRASKGNYAGLNATLNTINQGRGIGPVCE